MNDTHEHKKPPKEYIELLEKKLYIKPVGIANRLKEVQETIEKNIEPGKKRFTELLKQLDKRFPPNTPLRGSADGITYFLFDSAFELYFIGNNSALFIELQGLLERFCINKACDFIAVDDISKSILEDSFSKKTLNDIADYFQIISLWTPEEVKFARKLTQIRNGIAHKNGELVSKHLGDGQKKLMTSIDEITKKADAVPFIIQTIELIVKIADATKPSFFSNPRFTGRLEAYSSIIGLILNLFCDNEFIVLPNHVKFTMLNRLFGKSFLLGSEKLRNLLGEYKSKVIEFHDLLGVDENKSQELHKELVKLGTEIFDEMRNDLQIDGDSKIFVKPAPVKIDFVKIKREKNDYHNLKTGSMRLHVDKLEANDLGGTTKDMLKISQILNKFNITKNSLIKPNNEGSNIPTVVFHAGRYVVVFQYNNNFTKGSLAFINYNIDLTQNINLFADVFTPKVVAGFHEMQKIINQKDLKGLNLVELTDEPLISQTIYEN